MESSQETGRTPTPRTQQPLAVALALLLKERRMSQMQLCAASKVSKGTVSRYLGGSRGTKMDVRGARTLEKIASALSVTPDYFLEYRVWMIQRVALASPVLVDDFYDLMVETARLLGLLEERSDGAK